MALTWALARQRRAFHIILAKKHIARELFDGSVEQMPLRCSESPVAKDSGAIASTGVSEHG